MTPGLFFFQGRDFVLLPQLVYTEQFWACAKPMVALASKMTAVAGHDKNGVGASRFCWINILVKVKD